jgi:hypothetical protein
MHACSRVSYFGLPDSSHARGGDGAGSTTEQYRSRRLGLVCHFASSLLLCGTVP